jgi:hypothetical protein
MWSGLPHKNGERFVGNAPQPRVRELWMAGRCPVSILERRTVSSAIAETTLGEQLDVQHDGDRWWAWRGSVQLGRLSWRAETQARVTWFDYEIRYPDAGTLTVTHLLLTASRQVVNLSGYVTPRPRDLGSA